MKKTGAVALSLDDLDIQISRLREQADKLTREAEELERFRNLAAQFGTPVDPAADLPHAKTRITRREEILNFLLANGPQPRKKINERTGIPDGTIAYEMRDAETFVQLDDGRWDLTEAARFNRIENIVIEQGGEPPVTVNKEERTGLEVELEQHFPSNTPRAALALLLDHPGKIFAHTEVAERINANPETTRTALSRMCAKGIVLHAKKPKRGYFVPKSKEASE